MVHAGAPLIDNKILVLGQKEKGRDTIVLLPLFSRFFPKVPSLPPMLQPSFTDLKALANFTVVLFTQKGIIDFPK